MTSVKNETGKEFSLEKLKSVVNDAPIFQTTHEMQEINQRFSEQNLILQQKIQEENRQFSTISNLMKAKHAAAMSAINNIR
ncbi:MAG: hypothetical protein GY805_01985 [Chloroflexi bacterium]|nr:hypothetical protein [Chloroflexota bacterium]